MATHSIPSPTTKDRPLSRDEWWALFDKLRLAQQPDYAEYGGPIAFIRKEHDADTV